MTHSHVRLVVLLMFMLCSVPAKAEEPLHTTRVASGLFLPVFVVSPPGDMQRLFIVEKRGVIKILNLETGVINATPFLDINSLVGGGQSTNDERGLLGLAFHPNYTNNGLFYVNYTNNSDDTVVARYAVSGNPDIADSGSADTILTIFQPFSNHNGGWLGFGPNDDYLYIATGDGGFRDDPGNRGQDITDQLLGKMLRIDVDGDDFPADPNRDYAIPKDNPFVGVSGDDEIWAYGLRNPWRPSFDRLTGDMYIADVGQNAWEEVNFQSASSPGGENYGWRCYEGNQNFNTGGCDPPNTMVFPIHVYSHAVGFSITGGYAYRGSQIPPLQGTYFFADYVIQHVWSFQYDGANVNDFMERTADLSPSVEGFTVNQISSFGEDAAGEMYIVDQGSSTQGQIFKIGTNEVFPSSLAVIRGQNHVGDLEDVFVSDDEYLQARPSFISPPTTQEPPVALELSGTAQTTTASELRFTFEGQSFLPVGGAVDTRVFTSLFNFTTGEYDELDNRILPPAPDTTFDVIPGNPQDYIDDQTGEVRVLLEFKAEGFSGFLFSEALIDRATWVVTP